MTTPLAEVRSYTAPALEKGLDLLEALAAQTEPRSQTDLARVLGRSASEIFRMLDCLERRGYITKDPGSGRYRLTLRLYELAHTHSPVDQLLRAAAVPMRELTGELEQSCHLSVLSDGQLVVLAQVESPHRIRISVEVGARFPATRTASGRILLSVLEPEALARALEAEEEPRRKRLLAELLQVRRTGLYSGRSDLTRGVRDVAALVGNPAVGVAAALCVPSLDAVGRAWPLRELRARVRRAAESVTRNLGLTVSRKETR